MDGARARWFSVVGEINQLTWRLLGTHLASFWSKVNWIKEQITRKLLQLIRTKLVKASPEH